MSGISAAHLENEMLQPWFMLQLANHSSIVKFHDCGRGHRLTSALCNGYVRYIKVQVH